VINVIDRPLTSNSITQSYSQHRRLGDCDRVVRRPSGPVAIRIRVEQRIELQASSHSLTTSAPHDPPPSERPDTPNAPVFFRNRNSFGPAAENSCRSTSYSKACTAVAQAFFELFDRLVIDPAAPHWLSHVHSPHTRALGMSNDLASCGAPPHSRGWPRLGPG